MGRVLLFPSQKELLAQQRAYLRYLRAKCVREYMEKGRSSAALALLSQMRYIIEEYEL